MKKQMILVILIYFALFAGTAYVCNWTILGMYPAPFCTADGICVPEDYPTVTDQIVLTATIALIFLLPVILQYILIKKFEKPKPKRKNDQEL